MTATRIYVVTENGKPEQRLIRATFRATAVRHAAGTRFVAKAATQDDLERLITAGVRVEQAAEPTTSAEAPEVDGEGHAD